MFYKMLPDLVDIDSSSFECSMYSFSRDKLFILAKVPVVSELAKTVLKILLHSIMEFVARLYCYG